MRHLLRALARQPDPLSDANLLARYATDRDPAAFEVLVWRHGGMVLGVCRRHLRDTHAAEDAFQATFLVLSRKAGTVRGDTLPGWLHRVARRAAGRAGMKTRRRRETPLVAELPARPPADDELAAVLDAEIDRLPDRLRQVVVLCYLDNESTEVAATRLGIPRGTVLSRLHTARATLAARLTRRGVTPPVVGLTAILTAEQVSGGVRAAGGGIGPATILANEVLAMTMRKTVLVATMGLVLAGGAGTGVGVLSAQQGVVPKEKTAPPDKVAPPAAADPSVRLSDQLQRLEKANEQLTQRIGEVQARVQKERNAMAISLDPTALRAALVRMDEQILNIQFPLTSPSDRDLASRRVQQTRPDFESLTEAEINGMIDALPAAVEAASIVRREREAYDRLLQSGANVAELTIAKARLDAATDKLNEVRKPLRDEAIRAAKQKWNEAAVAEHKREAADAENRARRAEGLRNRRQGLAGQVAQAETQAMTLRRLIEEERILTEVRALVNRQRLALELGVSLPAGGTNTADALTERFDQLDRQLAELKATLSAQDGTSRLDAIERKLEQIRTAPGVQRR